MFSSKQQADGGTLTVNEKTLHTRVMVRAVQAPFASDKHERVAFLSTAIRAASPLHNDLSHKIFN